MLLEAIRSCQMLLLSEAAGGCWCQAVSDAVRNCQTLSKVVRSFVRSCRRLVRKCGREMLSPRKACHDVGSLSEGCLAAISMCRKLSESVRQRPEAVRHGLKLSDPVKGCLRRSLTARSCRRLSEVCQVLSDACQKLLEAVRTCQKLVRSCQMLVKSCQKQSGTVGGCQRLALSEACRKLAGSL